MTLKQQLAALFEQPKKNREAIQLALYELAGKICPADDDIRQQVWLHLNRTIDKYDTARGNPYGYFSQVGQRYKWEMMGMQKKHEELTEFTTGIQPRELETSQPVPESDPEKLLRKIMRKAKTQIAYLQPGSKEYEFAASGIHWLQCYAKELWGEYQPMTLPTIKYSRDRANPI